MQEPMNTNPVQVVVLTQPEIMDKQSIYKNMKNGLARQLIGLGVLQFLIGLLCIIFQGVSLWVIAIIWPYDRVYFLGHGFWSGLLFLITGPFGIAGGFKRSRFQVVAFNVLSIFSAVLASFLISFAIIVALLYAYGMSYDCDYYYSCNFTQKSETGLAMEAMMAILGLIEGIIAIRSSVVCCKIGACCSDCGGSCCCPPSPLQNQTAMTCQTFAGQQIMIATQQQQPEIFSPNQQPIFLLSPQHRIIGLDPQQQLAQYKPQQSAHSQHSNAYLSLSPAPIIQGPYDGLYDGTRNTPTYPEHRVIPGDRISSTYDEIHDYDAIVIQQK